MTLPQQPTYHLYLCDCKWLASKVKVTLFELTIELEGVCDKCCAPIRRHDICTDYRDAVTSSGRILNQPEREEVSPQP